MDRSLQHLAERRSTPSKLLGAPGPSEAQLAELLRVAVRVPDHGKLQPWRLIRISGGTGVALGERLAAIQRARDPGIDPATLEKDRGRFASAPLILTVVARITPGHKVPEQEQLLSAGLLAYNLLLGAQALGFGAQWLTGWPAYDAEAARLLGLAPNESVVAFVHIGTRSGEAPERPRPDPATLLSDLALT